jgi:sarcosine oxidase / L-pipecolate oxidase
LHGVLLGRRGVILANLLMSRMLNKDANIAIVGAGAWGLSTALHLHRAGFTKITLFDRAESIPSPYSAAYDLNKIVRAEYEDSFYTELALVSVS